MVVDTRTDGRIIDTGRILRCHVARGMGTGGRNSFKAMRWWLVVAISIVVFFTRELGWELLIGNEFDGQGFGFSTSSAAGWMIIRILNEHEGQISLESIFRVLKNWKNWREFRVSSSRGFNWEKNGKQKSSWRIDFQDVFNRITSNSSVYLLREGSLQSASQEQQQRLFHL